MAYSIIGIKNHKTMPAIAQVGHHNERTRETRNADPERRHLNERLVGSGDLCADVQARLDAAGVMKVRANGIRAVEIMQTASPEWFHQASPEQVRGWLDRSAAWVKGRYGDNLVSLHLHMDETSPQLHAVVVPITPDGRLCHKELFGHPAKLRDMHTGYNRAVAELGLERGTERSKAEHRDIQEWYHQMETPTREAWELARQVTIAPARAGEGLEERLARTIAPEIAAERTRATYWRDRAEQTERQLEGARERLRDGQMPSYERYGELARTVRDTELTDVLTGLGGRQDPHDRYKWHINGHELNVRGQKYYDFHAPEGARDAKGGGAIDLTKYVTGYDFRAAVDYLNERHYAGRALEAPAIPYRAQEEERGPFRLPEEHPDRWPEVRRYLVDARKCPADLVDEAHGRGDVYATVHQAYPNAVFVRRDPDGQAVGAYMRGTRGPFYGMAKDTTREAGHFSLDFGTPNRLQGPSLVLVESPIDAMSYAALKANGHTYGRIVSTDGNGPLPTREIERTLEQGGIVRAAFDKDGGGDRLWERVQEHYPAETSGNYTPVMRQTPKGKDWNEDLQRQQAQEHERSGPERGGHAMMPDF